MILVVDNEVSNSGFNCDDNENDLLFKIGNIDAYNIDKGDSENELKISVSQFNEEFNERIKGRITTYSKKNNT